MKRRAFLTNSLKTICVLGAGHTAQAFRIRKFPYLQRDVKYRFAIASDGHYGQPNTEFNLFHDEMMSWLNREHSQRELAFTLFNGDLIHDDPNFLAEVKIKYDQLVMPYYVSRGNHDRCSAELWQSTWGSSLNYSFEKKGAAFIVLDTSNEQGTYLCPDLEWTQHELSKFSACNEVFVFMHITPRKWTDNGIACANLTRLFSRQKNLKAIFHGHDHDQDNHKSYKGKPYFFDGHLGGNWGVDYRGYRLVEVLHDGSVVTFQVNPADAVTVNKTEMEYRASGF